MYIEIWYCSNNTFWNAMPIVNSGCILVSFPHPLAVNYFSGSSTLRALHDDVTLNVSNIRHIFTSHMYHGSFRKFKL